MMLPDARFGLGPDEDDALNQQLLLCMMGHDRGGYELDQSFYDMAPAETQTASQASELKTPPLPHQELFSPFEFLESNNSPDPISDDVLNREIQSVLTPRMVDLSVQEWTLPLRDDVNPLPFPYELADDFNSWDDTKFVAQDLDFPEAAAATPDVLQVMPRAPSDTGSSVKLDSDMQPLDALPQRDTYWLETLGDFPELMFQSISMTPSVTSSTVAATSLSIESLEDDDNDADSPDETVYTEVSDSADEAAPTSPHQVHSGIMAPEDDVRKKLPTGAPKPISATGLPSSPIPSRNARKLAARRKRRHLIPVQSPEPVGPPGRSGPPYKKIDQMDSASRQLLDRILVCDREPPVGKPVPYSIIMNKLSSLFCGAEETLRGHYRRLTKPKDQRVRKPVWQEHDVRLLEEAVRRCQANTKRKISWTAVRDYIVCHGGSYKFGVTACSKKWYSLSE
ncbi:hypothetical protein GQ602_006976 [Ophiocordyceps camponoti-floridani]|uniref:Myb-like domain-containing protein n=1 Tax=Ophiocordyceps camponoti-floridani TaxID=2030778 RepID=A0A8H4Q0D8_9HYPO|nr:hypothetical protein GQ602_006976 [Ophiocordyceps camponoti-floridani]